MNIWSPLIQKFPKLEASAVFFFANQQALANMPPPSQKTFVDVQNVINEKSRMLSVMGTYHYTMAVVDITTITEECVNIRAIPVQDEAFSKFSAWMHAEFPGVETKKALASDPATWFILRDANLIKFRYMFTYVK